ncbi:hypothetical protein L1987_14074 [Smallanthus sonchifolius]|uniref:Uncharacterized protein n=1 Tax=Smallanthus sonchifolius TaxID=185202 RepID=A0ACB9J1M4_9ASTR|nr:hypothetical protein L1987_14074 [Smallanthus sonchifolius]
MFIDRDPEIFSVILSLLRTNRLPSPSRRFTKQELSDEASYYGIESQLKSVMLPNPLSSIDASVVATIQPASDGIVSAFTAIDDGSVWIACRARVTAIADSPDSVFSAFDSNHKENCILAIDKSTLQVTSEIGRQSGNSSKSIVLGTLTYVNDLVLLTATAVTSGACNFIKLSNN